MVAHSLGVIAVPAGVGVHVLDSDPREARRAVEHISRTSRTSLAETRTLLGVLRSDDHDALAPAPNLADLWRLAAEIRDAGLPGCLAALELALLPALPPGVELAGYRIVQEALTNALRHAHARLATVRLETIPGALRIVVRDDGQGPGAGHTAGGGHGLIGMR